MLLIILEPKDYKKVSIKMWTELEIKHLMKWVALTLQQKKFC